MAFRMSHWLALASVLLSGVAVLGLTTPPVGPLGGRGENPEQRRFLELDKEMSRQAWLYQRIQWRDSLVGELLNGVAEGRSVVLGLPSEAPDTVRDRLGLAVELQLQDLGLEEPAMPLGVFVLPRSQGSHPQAPLQLSGLAAREEYYLARGGEEPYCVIAVSYPDQGEDNPFQDGQPDFVRGQNALARRVASFAEVSSHSRATPNTLGICRYFVRYGVPGEQMMAWLRAGASRFAESVFEIDHHLLLNQGPARGPFGQVRWGFSRLPPKTLSCLSNGREDCLGILLGPDIRLAILRRIPLDYMDLLAGSPVDFVEGYPNWGYGLLGLEPYLFFSIEQEFGSERFGEFWRSPRPPVDAFEAVFGEALDLWVMRWLQQYLDPSPRGPGVPVQATLFTVLALGILAGGAVRMGRR